MPLYSATVTITMTINYYRPQINRLDHHALLSSTHQPQIPGIIESLHYKQTLLTVERLNGRFNITARHLYCV